MKTNISHAVRANLATTYAKWQVAKTRDTSGTRPMYTQAMHFVINEANCRGELSLATWPTGEKTSEGRR